MKLIFLEFTDEYECFLDYLDKNNLDIQEFTIIALEPKLQSFLKISGTNYLTTLPFFNKESHTQIISHSEQVMQFLASHYDFIDSNNLTNTYREEFLFWIRLIVNYCDYIIEIIHNAFLNYPHADFYGVSFPVNCSGEMLLDRERYLPQLLEKMGQSQQRNVHLIMSDHPFSIDKQKRNNQILEWLNYLFKKMTLVLLHRFIHSGRNILFTDFAPVMQRLGNSIRQRSNVQIIYLSKNYNFMKHIGLNIWHFFRQTGHVFISLDMFNSSKTKESNLLQSLEDILCQAENAQLLSYKDINIASYLLRKYQQGIKGYFQKLLNDAQKISELFRLVDPQLIISRHNRGYFALLGEYTKVHYGKSLFVSHGTHPLPSDKYTEIELYNLCKGFMLGDYTHITVSTPVQENHLHYYKSKYKNIQNIEIKAPPLVFAQIASQRRVKLRRKYKINDKEKVILYAISQKHRNGLRFHFIETQDEFFSALTDVVNSVNAMDNCKLIIRMHPGYPLNQNEIKSLLPESNKIIVSKTGSFEDVLTMADVVISYSSTCIDEALINGMPVILYDKFAQYNHFNTTVFENKNSSGIYPVCYVNNQNKLKDALTVVLNKKESSEEADFTPYRYEHDYTEIFYEFIKEVLKS